ncbi:MAG: autotransporter outer membrane beta-barrel domain-containing protein, partial [Succinivibrionaceae bacterium]|nr:autotransporter outer membrane beta-barrel domain-containing protein [Succinivibrionaceae bacterium]
GAAQSDALDLSSTTVYGGATRVTSPSAGDYTETAGNTIYASGIVSVKALKGYSTLSLNVSSVNSMGSDATAASGKTKAVIISTSAVDLSGKSLTVTTADSAPSGNYALVYSDAGVTAPDSGSVTLAGTFAQTSYSGSSVKKAADGELLYLEAKNSGGGSSTTYTKEAETLSAAHLSSAALASSVNSFSANEGLAAAVAAAAAPGSSGIAGFGAMGGGSNRYEIGSHVNINSFNAAVGAARRFERKNGDSLTVSAFVDIGTGTSKPHVGNSSASADNTLYGAGLGARYSLKGGAFLDASARVGRARAEFKGSYLRTGLETKYDSRATYYGLSLGGGYRLGVNDALALTPYARYTLTHLGSDTVSLRGLTSRLHPDPVTAHTLRAGVDARWRLSNTAALNAGDSVELTPYARYTLTHLGSDTVSLRGLTSRLHLDSVTAHTLRAGVDARWRLSNTAALTAGLAVERTWKGRAESQLGGIDLKAPSLAGTSGIIDVGVTLTPGSVKGLSLSLGASGRLGDVRGATGTLRVAYAF